MSEEQTIISPASDPQAAERTQAITPSPHHPITPSVAAAEVTQAALVIQCPVCHTANPPGDRWCQDCGFLLTSPAPEALDQAADREGMGQPSPRLVLDGREFELQPGTNRIGRVGADVLLPDATVSRHHATLTLEENGTWIEDAGSTNGTFLNGSPVAAGDRRPVRDGDTLQFGSVTVTLRGAVGHPPPGLGEDAGVTDSAPPADESLPIAALVGADGSEFSLRPGVTTLGRRAENMIALSGDSYASGRHAEVRCDAGGCVLVDVGSTNGTFLCRGGSEEWERLRPHDPQPLTPGDELRLGQTTFTFQAAEAMEEEVSAGADTPVPDAPPAAPDEAVESSE